MSVDNGAAPEYGEAVERAICDLEDLDYVDGAHADGRRDDGSRIQIKGTQRFVSNGGGKRARGRFAVWSETLTTFLFDNESSYGSATSEYVLAVYDADEFDPHVDDPEEVDPEAFIEGYVVASPTVVGEAVDDSWQEAHRPAKGERGRIRWNTIEDLVDEVGAVEVTA